LLSGHHENIEKWRRYQSLKRTWERRPDLLAESELSEEDMKLLDKDKRGMQIILLSSCIRLALWYTFNDITAFRCQAPMQ
jgi:hypothetical protein